MDCNFKLRVQEGGSELTSMHIFANTNTQEFCSAPDLPPDAPGGDGHKNNLMACLTSSDCRQTEYCDNVEHPAQVEGAEGTCKKRLAENRDCNDDDMCKLGLECRLAKFETTKKCHLKSSISMNHELGADL